MPKVIKRSTQGVTQRFAFYDGPTPPATTAVYRGVIKKTALQMSSGGNPMIVNLVEFQANDGDPRGQYDGYPARVNITLGDHESLREREQAFYLAVAGKEDVDIVQEGDFSKFKAGDKQESKVLKIGGKNPVGTIVLVRVRPSQDPAYPLDMDGIYPTRESSADKYAGKKVDTSDEDEVEDEDVAEGYTQEELAPKSLAALRKILVDEFDADADEVKNLKKKTDLIDAILAAQDGDGEDDEDEEDLEDEDDEDLDEDEDEDEDEEDAETELRDELAGLDRAALKARLRKYDKEFRITTKTSDDAIRDQIVTRELDPENPPF